jgi:hypothetical protein
MSFRIMPHRKQSVSVAHLSPGATLRREVRRKRVDLCPACIDADAFVILCQRGGPRRRSTTCAGEWARSGRLRRLEDPYTQDAN